MISGNKGEWSEFYTFLKLLCDNKLYAADENLEKLENLYFDILKIIRTDNGEPYDYKPNLQNEKIQIWFNNQLKAEFEKSEFKEHAEFLLNFIKQMTTRTSSCDKIEQFMKKLFCTKIKASSNDKSDITMQLHDPQTGYNPICGFSIKSYIGGKPTLLNASQSTNFTFEILNFDTMQINKINSMDTKKKIKGKLLELENYKFKFHSVKNEILEDNLMLIDSEMPKILAYSLKYYYMGLASNCKEICNILEKENPLNIRKPKVFYEYKFKKLLCAVALGMKPKSNWDGIDEANGGYIAVFENGEILAYHIYNRNFFEEYLLQNTKFETPSSSRHKYGYLYEEDNKVFLDLNLQIRFK